MSPIILAVLLLVSTASALDFYETPHDDIDINTITTEDLKILYECLLSRRPCSSDNTIIKNLYPEILDTKCKRCNARHKYIIKTLIDRAERDIPEEYLAFRNMYDPAKYNAYYASLTKF